MPLAYNSTDLPIVADDTGRVIAGHEHGQADPDFPGVRSALESGTLLWSDAVPEADGPQIPPKSGRGSSEDAWREYARINSVNVESAQSRDDIIAVLDAAGVPTEAKE